MYSSVEKVFISDIQIGQEVNSLFLLDEVRLGETKNGKPYVSLKLRDRTGQMEARVWDGAREFFETFVAGGAAQVQGVADSFQNQIQLKIISASPLDKTQVDLSLFLPASQYDPEEMMAALLSLAAAIKDPHLRGLLEDLFQDPELSALFKRAPAAKRFHHAFLGGLLEHTLSVMRLAVRLTEHYPVLHRDLLLAGAALHDLGKVREFDQEASGDYTDEGRLLGHLVIGVQMVEEKMAQRPGFPPKLAMLLKHLIISHHGEYDLGSPKKPKTLEALVLHNLDDLDAKMNGIGGFIERHADAETGWTDYNRLLERFFYRPFFRDYCDGSGEETLGPETEASPVPAEAQGGPAPGGRLDTDQLSLLKD